MYPNSNLFLKLERPEEQKTELSWSSWAGQSEQCRLDQAEHEQSEQSWAVRRAEWRKQSWGGLEEKIVAEGSEHPVNPENGTFVHL